MTVNMLPADIVHGKRRSADQCALALCVTRYIDPDLYRVEFTPGQMVVRRRTKRHAVVASYKLPIKVQQFVLQFDNDQQTPEPITFEIACDRFAKA
jgi:hypothetical protein